jgi:hypothetical protein
VCGINDHGHTCDEYLVLFTKSGMTPERLVILVRDVSKVPADLGMPLS